MARFCSYTQNFRQHGKLIQYVLLHSTVETSEQPGFKTHFKTPQDILNPIWFEVLTIMMSTCKSSTTYDKVILVGQVISTLTLILWVKVLKWG